MGIPRACLLFFDLVRALMTVVQRSSRQEGRMVDKDWCDLTCLLSFDLVFELAPVAKLLRRR